jgi:hypothetical protein
VGLADDGTVGQVKLWERAALELIRLEILPLVRADGDAEPVVHPAVLPERGVHGDADAVGLADGVEVPVVAGRGSGRVAGSEADTGTDWVITAVTAHGLSEQAGREWGATAGSVARASAQHSRNERRRNRATGRVRILVRLRRFAQLSPLIRRRQIRQAVQKRLLPSPRHQLLLVRL